MNCPQYVKNCINALISAGYTAHAVGGAVRDSILGKEPFDWDVTTSALPAQTLEVFKNHRTIPTGIKHGTVTVLFEENEKTYPVEITTYRIDGEYLDSRHPESVKFSTLLADDLSRRDFTVNAMAWNENDGITDPFCGKRDLENGIIRAVGDPEIRFSEDALRILRAYRFSAQLGFEIEEKTLAATATCAHLLKKIARERIGAELKKMLASKTLTYSLSKMIENGIWSALFETKAPSAKCIQKLSTLSPENYATRLAALASELNENERQTLLTSLRLSNSEQKLVLRLSRVKNFDINTYSDPISATARRFLHLYENILPLALEMCEYFGNIPHFEEFKKIVNEESSKGCCLTLADLAVNGNDLIPLCNGNRRQIGTLLGILLRTVIENPELNDKNTLLSLAEEIIKT